jgi:phosphatidylglycerol lysyltransferase
MIDGESVRWLVGAVSKKFFFSLRRFWPIAALALIIVSCRKDLQQVSYSRVAAIVQAADPFWILITVISTVAGLAVMGLYDLVCFAGSEVHRGQRWKRGVLAFAWSNFFSVGPLAGPAIRFWLYREPGLPTATSAQALVSILAGFAAGLTLWTIVSVLVPNLFLQVFVVFAAACILGTIVKHFRKIERLPTWLNPSLNWPLLFAVGVADWLLALISFLSALKAAGLNPSMSAGAQMFFLGQSVGLISLIPGGFGTADTFWISKLANPTSAAAALFLYRIIYYIAPWIVSSIFLLRIASKRQARWGGPARFAISLMVLASGVILLISSATPVLRYRLHILHRFLPLAALETSHLTAVLTGMILIVLAIQLKKGYRDAFMTTTSLLIVGSIASILKGLDVEEGVVLLVTALVLYAHEPLFQRKGSAQMTGWSIMGPVLLGTAIFAGAGLTAYPNLTFAKSAWLTVRFGGNAARFLRGLGALILVAILVAIDWIIRTPSRFAAPSEEEMQRALNIFRRKGTGTSALTLVNGDKSICFGPNETFSLYRTIGRYMVVFSDPVVDSTNARDFTGSLLDKAAELDRSLIFYQVSAQWLPVLHDFGYVFFKLGEEAIIDLQQFNIQGNKGKAMRNVLNRFNNDGFVFRVLSPDKTIQRMSELRAVSDAWLKKKGSREKQFSVGYFDETYLAECPCATVSNSSGQIVAFANILEGLPHGEYSIDLMRYLPSCPNGVMDFLFLNILEWGRANQYATFNMGMAPLSTVGQTRQAYRRERIARWFFHRGEQWYNFQGLRQFKEKYDPLWVPRYLAYPKSWDWLPVIAHVATLIGSDPVRNKSRQAATREPEVTLDQKAKNAEAVT